MRFGNLQGQCENRGGDDFGLVMLMVTLLGIGRNDVKLEERIAGVISMECRLDSSMGLGTGLLVGGNLGRVRGTFDQITRL